MEPIDPQKYMTPFQPPLAASPAPAPIPVLTARPMPRPQSSARFGQIPGSSQKGFRLFTFLGVTTYIHWSWLLILVYDVQMRSGQYHSLVWSLAEVLSLFAIVLMHEYGHALACNSVGGRAHSIMLWPFGGVATVTPPQRPGAYLWTIAAGPLVQVVLAPIFWYAMTLTRGMSEDVQTFAYSVAVVINLGLLAFNLLPIYPLDGGQIVRGVLWFLTGRSWSLLLAGILGIVGNVGGGIYLVIRYHSMWIGILALLGGRLSYFAIKAGWAGIKAEALPRRQDALCPSCGKNPPMGPLWTCPCGARIDIFAHHGACPACGRTAASVACPACNERSPIYLWMPMAQIHVNAD